MRTTALNNLVFSLALCALALSTRDAAAQVFFVQGEDGQGLDCAGSDCTLDGNLTITGDLGAAGTGTLDALDAQTLTVETSYWLPECPEGYARDTSCPACGEIVLCEKGSDQMVKVGNFWIDRYEASVWQNADCTAQLGASGFDYGAFQANGNWSTPAYACSVSGVTPSRYLSWFQALEACALSGKHLCTNEEWQAAAAGTYDPGNWPDTDTSDGCWSSPSAGGCVTCSWGFRTTGNAGDDPGASGSCVSIWGAEDMIGNLWEWTAWWSEAGRQWQTSDGQEASGVWGAGYGNDSTWNVNAIAQNGSTWTQGLPVPARRGGNRYYGTKDGIYTTSFYLGIQSWTDDGGARCCRGR